MKHAFKNKNTHLLNSVKVSCNFNRMNSKSLINGIPCDCRDYSTLLCNAYLLCKQMVTILTLTVLETSLYTFANNVDPDQRAPLKAL